MKDLKLEKLLETHEGVKVLKNAAIRIQNFELASNLRGYEKEKFPEEANKFKEEKELANTVIRVLHMADLNVPTDEMAYTIHECIKLFIEKGSSVDIIDMSNIQAKAKEIFN